MKHVIVAAALACVACSSNPALRSPEGDVDIGYGTKAANKVAGSVGSVTREDINRMRFARIEDMIAATVPGVRIIRSGNNISLQLRGQNTILGETEPLIVLDGVPLAQGTGGFSLSTLSPQDVERIDVLKDAGSTAIYGSRGANGVIIINTRRAR
jgi:TonB-dependent starch-binding outer membrane protein SusC